MMLFLRSFLFNFCFFGWSLLSAFLFAPFFLTSTQASQRVGKMWANGVLRLARPICGLTYEVRGREYLVDGPVIYASKHQSAWDTVIFLTFYRCPAYVLKRELLRIPFWGWYLWRMRMIAIDRSAGASSMKHMLRQAKAVLDEQRPIVIFPEGSRMKPGNPPHYHPGIIALYSQLKVPVIPVALNSGFYWGKNAFIKRPGKIIIEFLPPIAPGLPKGEFMARLEGAIEPAAQRLLEEAKAACHGAADTHSLRRTECAPQEDKRTNCAS